MKPIEKARVLVTGGSKGIGQAIAEKFAEHGHDLVLVARSEDRLEDTARRIRERTGVDVLTIPMDLTGDGAAEKLFSHVEQADLHIDILVNNAGVGMTGAFAQGDQQRMTQMLRLNMLVLSELTRRFLPPMLARGKGRILNVGSVVAYFSGAPNWSAYVASKHYVLAFTRGLSRELRNTGVAATVVSPGTTATDFVETADAASMRAYQASGGVSVEAVARTAYRACQKGRTAVVPGLFNKVLAFLGELPPRAIAFEVFAFLSQKTNTP
ncbi:SDR family NAD(P)-dependent oxidoreductase [Thiolapillus sp.]